MPGYNPELIAIMRAALEDVMARVPVEQASFTIKVRLAEFILKAASEGQTTYDALYSAGAAQIQTVLSMVM